MSAILTFLGGGAFRAIWGEVSSYFQKRQDHKYEIERAKVQGELDAAQHTRNLEALKLQSELGIKTIGVQADADVARSEAEAFREAMSQAYKPTGIWIVDVWNGTIRPAFATVSLALWLVALVRRDFNLSEWDLSMIGAIAGYYFADRTLRKLKK